MNTSECIKSIKILVKTGIKDIILHAHTFPECNGMSRISNSILSSRTPEVKLLLHLLNRSKMTSLNETQNKIFLEKVDNKQAEKPESSPPNLDEGIPHF